MQRLDPEHEGLRYVESHSHICHLTGHVAMMPFGRACGDGDNDPTQRILEQINTCH